MRTAVLSVALAFIGLFAYLVLAHLADRGIHNLADLVLNVGSLLVLALLGIGIVGALRNPPDE